MLYTDIESFLHFFVKNLANEIKSLTQLFVAFDLSEIGPGHLSNFGGVKCNSHAGEVGYFKDETKGDPINEFVGLRPKMYFFTTCFASEPIPGLNNAMNGRHKAVAIGVSPAQIMRFKQDDYVRMFNGGALTNVVNRRIGSKLHYVALAVNNLQFNNSTLICMICMTLFLIK